MPCLSGRAAVFALLPLLLAACAPSASLPAAGRGPAAPGGSRCDAEAGRWAVGQPATEATVTKLRQDSGAAEVRSIAPGQPTTRDLRPDRLNVFLDADHVVARLSCG
jgi:hypothetical protein